MECGISKCLTGPSWRCIVKMVKMIWNHNLDGHCTRLKYYVRRNIATESHHLVACYIPPPNQVLPGTETQHIMTHAAQTIQLDNLDVGSQDWDVRGAKWLDQTYHGSIQMSGHPNSRLRYVFIFFSFSRTRSGMGFVKKFGDGHTLNGAYVGTIHPVSCVL